jgi:diguanylate cyclase (GGDEF)-like protein
VFSTIGFILVIQSLKNARSPIKSIKLFNLYFILGVIGWIMFGVHDYAKLNINLTINLIFYIVCSFILLLAVAECSRNKKSTVIIGLLHIILIVFSLFLNDDKTKIVYLSTYAILIYSLISYIAIKRAYLKRNVGDGLIGYVSLFIVGLSLFQVYVTIVFDDLNFALGVILIGNSTGFMLVGIGFLTSILITEHKQLKLLTLKDPLTGLLNRRGMDYSLKFSLNSAPRLNKCISAIAVDIDYFKKINDTYGHDGGDKVLQELGKILSEYTRSQDVCCRLGGEKFIIVQPDTSIDVATKVANRIKKHIEELELPYENQLIKLTSSFGVSSYCGEVDIDLLLKNADKALYTAKYEGRNRVCTAY